MRNRLVLAFVGLTFAVITLYGVPRAYFLVSLVENDQERLVARVADLVAPRVADAQAAGTLDTGLLQQLVAPGERIAVTLADGTHLVVPDGPDASYDLAAERDLPDGGSVEVALADSVVSGRVTDALVPLFLIGLALLGGSLLVGLLLARRLARPFVELAETARRVGTGHNVASPAGTIPEARAIEAALRESSGRIETLLQHERDLAVNASHELRTPITSLRLSLEDLALWPGTTSETREELGRLVNEVDRLSVAVTTLLEGGESSVAPGVDVDLVALARDAVTGLPRAAVRSEGPVIARAPAETVHATLRVLLDALADAATLVVTVADRDTHRSLTLDASPSPDAATLADAVRRGQLLASAVGGRVLVEDRGFTLVLPAPPLRR